MTPPPVPPGANAEEKCPFVSRGGLKLAHALDTFSINPTGFTCADLGCSTGGFTDCLLQRGAARVFSVDTGYGVLAYKLRVDPRVKVMERTNALHASPPEPVDLVVMDVSWTPMRHALPAAMRWLKPGGSGGADASTGGVIALIKPHYERSSKDKSARGILSDAEAESVTTEVLAEIVATLPLRLVGKTPSPIKGGGGKHKEGNTEWLAMFAARA
jgi:23S rRNA (cytidine1920-2'-O)/16S rRNA (cytidine1409-2'-O)-methyltransferase